jgi:hypothetical protein
MTSDEYFHGIVWFFRLNIETTGATVEGVEFLLEKLGNSLLLDDIETTLFAFYTWTICRIFFLREPISNRVTRTIFNRHVGQSIKSVEMK